VAASAEIKTNYVKRPPRLAMAADVTVVDGCGRQLQSRLWNISDGGFMVECEEKVPLGALVTVELPGQGAVRAEVRWVLGWRFGAVILEDQSGTARR
jgi:PilZ domain